MPTRQRLIQAQGTLMFLIYSTVHCTPHPEEDLLRAPGGRRQGPAVADDALPDRALDARPRLDSARVDVADSFARTVLPFQRYRRQAQHHRRIGKLLVRVGPPKSGGGALCPCYVRIAPRA